MGEFDNNYEQKIEKKIIEKRKNNEPINVILMSIDTYRKLKDELIFFSKPLAIQKNCVMRYKGIRIIRTLDVNDNEFEIY